MIKIVRTEYCRVTREYTYNINDEELQEITNDLKSRVVDPNTVPEITYNHIKLALEDEIQTTADENEFHIDDVELLFKSRYHEPYTGWLIEALQDIIHETIWDAPSEELDWDTDDYVDDWSEED